MYMIYDIDHLKSQILLINKTGESRLQYFIIFGYLPSAVGNNGFGYSQRIVPPSTMSIIYFRNRQQCESFMICKSIVLKCMICKTV